MNQYGIEFIDEIKKEYELPCYIFDEISFVENYRELRDTLRKQYSLYEIAYSYKTNYAPKICEIVKDLGGYAEVVSDMEYEIAKKVGYDNSKIIYNGPFKGPKLIEHLLNNGITNIDNQEELSRIIAFASEHEEHTFKVGIRVNIDVGQGFISRFGIDTSELDAVCNHIRNYSNIKLVGLHCHIGRARGLDAWKKRTETMLVLADKYIEGIPEYIDLGSGMFGKLDDELVAQFGCSIPTYFDYANVTANLVNAHYLACDKKPVLFTEPGTTLDNKYVDFVAEVDSIKLIKGQHFAVLNASTHNLGDVCTAVQLPMQVLHNATGDSYTNLKFVGYTCLEQDVLYQGYTGELSKGDYVIFGNVGGYSNVDKPPFILPQCAMIGYTDSQRYLIKRKETVSDILETYVIRGEL